MKRKFQFRVLWSEKEKIHARRGELALKMYRFCIFWGCLLNVQRSRFFREGKFAKQILCFAVCPKFIFSAWRTFRKCMSNGKVMTGKIFLFLQQKYRLALIKFFSCAQRL